MHANTRSYGLVLIVLLLAVASSLASAKSGKERDIVKRLQRNLEQQQIQKQQIEQEKNALIEKANQQDTALKNTAAEKAKLESQVQHTFKQKQDLQAELRILKTELESANQKLNRSETDRNNLSQQTQELTAQLANEKKENSEFKAQNAILKTNFETASTAQHTATKMQESCEVKNKQLFQYSKALINHYHNTSFWQALKQNEPFLGFGGVELQNLLQEYKDKIDQEKITSN